MVGASMTYYRITYAPAGFWPRRCVVHSVQRERHGHTDWLHATQAVDAQPIYMCETDVTEIVAVVV